MTLIPEVSAKYRVDKAIKHGAIHTSKWGRVVFKDLNLKTADYLVNSGFPYLTRKNKKDTSEESTVPET